MPPSLRFLKWLVITLLVVMIGGVIAIVSLLVTHIPKAGTDAVLPAAITLPQGEMVSAVTLAKGLVLVVTESGRVLAYGTDGVLRQEIVLK